MKKLLLLTALVFCLNGNAQIITTIAGNGMAGFTGDNGLATTAELNSPSGLAIDSSGNIYIADYSNSRIRKINTSGVIITIGGNGTANYSGDGGQATAAGLIYPFGLTLDAAENLLIADTYGNRVRKIDMITGIISTVAGNGTLGFSGDGGQATNAELSHPHGLAVDKVGNIYIADGGNNRIRMVNTLGVVTTFAGTGTAGYSGNNGQATAAALDAPSAIVFDAVGNLYVVEEQNSTVRKIDASGIINTVVGIGTHGFSGDGGQATAAKLNDPFGLTIDSLGNLYIPDTYNQRIRKVTASTGVINTIAGNGYSTIVGGIPTGAYSGDGGQATAAEINQPTSIALDKLGNLYIADYKNNRIRKVANATQVGIESFIKENNRITIYPNPAQNSITISGKQLTEIQITNVLGQPVWQNTLYNVQNTSIDISTLQSGVYFVRVGSSTQKFIKQ